MLPANGREATSRVDECLDFAETEVGDDILMMDGRAWCAVKCLSLRLVKSRRAKPACVGGLQPMIRMKLGLAISHCRSLSIAHHTATPEFEMCFVPAPNGQLNPQTFALTSE